MQYLNIEVLLSRLEKEVAKAVVKNLPEGDKELKNQVINAIIETFQKFRSIIK